MANQVASKQTINIVPVQGIFGPEPTFTPITLVGPAGSYFYPVINPVQSGLTITDSTIDSSVIGGNVPAAAYFSTAQVAAAPVADDDIANKAYVDSIAQGLNIKASCAYATTGDITLSGLGTQANGDWSGTLTAGDRILVKNQTNQAQNGIYAANSGAWTRTADMDVWSEVPSAFTFIQGGVTLSGTGWVCVAGSTGTIDVTNMPWTQFSGAGTYNAGNGLQLIGQTFSVKLNGTSLDASASGLRISTTYPGQTSITTLGTIGTGTWEATDVAVLHGGTGASDAAGARSNLSAAVLGANNDITSMSAITGSIATPTYVDFNTTQSPLPTDATGRIYFDNNDQFKTLAIQTATGVVQKIGEELYYRVKCDGAISKGQVVSFAGTLGASGGLKGKAATGLTVDQANYILGVATQSGNNNDWIFVTTFGEIKGIDTTGGAESWVQGQVLYYDPTVTGGLTKTKPAAPNPIAIVAAVVYVHASNGILFIRPTYGSVLGGSDGNVQFSTLNNLDVIQYDSTGQYWKNVAASTLSVSYAATAGSAGSATTATTATNLAGGSTGAVPYQSGANATTFLNLGTSTYIMTAGASAPTWTNPASITVGSATSATSATTATNLAGGAAASIPYQSGSGTTTFLASSAGDAGKVLQSNGTSAPTWVTPTAYATVTDDTTTNSTYYPLFANVTSGNLSTEYVSSTKLQYNPSTGLFTATGFSGSGASLTNLPAGQLSGTIPSGVLGNSTVYIGTTAIALNRASASQSLTGVSIDGSAGTAGTATNANNIAITDNTSSASTWYPVISAASTGNNAATVSSTKLSFVPSTGTLTATSLASTAGATFATSSGNVGIGTSSPQAKLDVAAGSGGTPTYVGYVRIGPAGAQSLNTASGLEFLASTFSSGYGWRVTGNDLGGGSTPFVIESRANSATWTERMRIDSSGNVGIGASAPGATGYTSFLALGNNNAGIGNAGTNKIGIVTNNVERILVDNAGNVGIGTSSPSFKLSLGATSTSGTHTIGIEDGDINSGNNLIVKAGGPFDGYTYRTGGNLTLSAGSTSNAGTNIYLQTASATVGGSKVTPATRMTIDGSGNVGIGTSSPGYKLHVVGAIYGSTSINTPGALYSDDGTTISRVISSGGISYWGTTTNHPVVYQTNNTERMRIDSSGNVAIKTIGSWLGFPDSGGALSAFGNGMFIGTSGQQLRLIAGNSDGTIAFSTTSTAGVANERMRITSGGLVQIGPLNASLPIPLTVTGTMTPKLLQIVDSTASSPLTNATYKTPAMLIERYTNTAAQSQSGMWGNLYKHGAMNIAVELGSSENNEVNGQIITLETQNGAPAGGTLYLVGHSVLVNSEAQSGTHPPLFGANYSMRFATKVGVTKPRNLVGIEVDMVNEENSATESAILDSANGDNYTGFWAQSAGGAAGSGKMATCGLLVSGTADCGWRYGVLVYADITNWCGYFRTIQNVTGANGLLVETKSTNAGTKIVQFRSNATDRFVIDGAGQITALATYSVAVGATNRDLYIDNTGVIGYVVSVRESKNNIESLNNISWLYDLNPVQFNYRKKDEDGNYTDEIEENIQYGLIAEEVEQINPDLCSYDIVNGKRELRTVQYSKLVPALVHAVKELKAEIASLKLH